MKSPWAITKYSDNFYFARRHF